MDNVFFHCTGTVAAGTSHIAKGKQCEDAIYRAGSSNGVQAIALCDGAGSAAYARQGAELTAQTAAELAAKDFSALWKMSASKREKAILDVVLMKLYQRAKALETDISELSCTLLLAALDPADGRGFTLHIGDGLIIGRNTNGQTRLLSYYRGRVHLNLTRFVTSIRTECVTARTSDITGFLLTSDGPEPYLANGRQLLRTSSMLLDLSFLLPEQKMNSEYSSLIQKMKKHGMYDDASFITLTKNSAVESVFHTMHTKLRKQLYGVSEQTRRSTERQTAAMLSMLAQNPDGLSLHAVRQTLHVHKDRIAKERLRPMLRSGAVQFRGGRYYLHAGEAV